MTGQITGRIQQSLAGALGGGLFWAVIRASEKGVIDDYVALILSGAILTLFGALLALAGPLGIWRALPRAAILAVVAGALIWLTRLRFQDVSAFFETPLPALAGLAVATLPVPFLVAAGKTRWNDYPLLFLEAWSIALRFAAALAFAGLVWLVIFLSDEVLQIVGIDLIRRLIEQEGAILVISGAMVGLGMAVIHDIADVASPYVLLRLFRLFLPLVLGVMAVFLLALPFRGLEGLAGALSPSMLLLVMVGAGITLVSIVVDQSDDMAARNPVLVRSAQAMSVLLPVMAALALWAIWLRVGQHGWSPGRVFVALVGGLGLGYGLVYAGAVLRGAGWMERIRQGNIRMVLVVIALAALWLTPVLNAERISAQDQLTRYLDGRLPAEELDTWTLGRWGKPGAEVLARLEAMAQEPGHEALAAHLAGGSTAPVPEAAEVAANLAAVLPLQPATATGTRDTILPAVEVWQLQDWLQVCQGPLAGNQPPCLMVVADLMPAVPGEEALVFLRRSPDYVEVLGLFIDDHGFAQYRTATHPDGRAITAGEAMGLMDAWAKAPPPVTPAQLNQVGTGADGLMILP